jgi:hypothetical protein
MGIPYLMGPGFSPKLILDFLGEISYLMMLSRTLERPIRRTREGGSEWEPINILLEGDGGSNKMNMASNTCLQLTTQVGQDHAATAVLLALGTNNQPHRPENAAEHKPRALLTYTGQAGEHHQLDQSLLVKLGDFQRIAPTPVRPVQLNGQTGSSQKAPKHQTGLPSSKLTQS